MDRFKEIKKVEIKWRGLTQYILQDIITGEYVLRREDKHLNSPQNGMVIDFAKTMDLDIANTIIWHLTDRHNEWPNLVKDLKGY
jgi:hypothetical protein